MAIKTKTKKELEILMDMNEAINYLKKMGEWEAVRNMDRDTVIKWASYLKLHEDAKKTKK